MEFLHGAVCRMRYGACGRWIGFDLMQGSADLPRRWRVAMEDVIRRQDKTTSEFGPCHRISAYGKLFDASRLGLFDIDGSSMCPTIPTYSSTGIRMLLRPAMRECERVIIRPIYHDYSPAFSSSSTSLRHGCSIPGTWSRLITTIHPPYGLPFDPPFPSFPPFRLFICTIITNRYFLFLFLFLFYPCMFGCSPSLCAAFCFPFPFFFLFLFPFRLPTYTAVIFRLSFVNTCLSFRHFFLVCAAFLVFNLEFLYRLGEFLFFGLGRTSFLSWSLFCRDFVA